MDRLILVVDDDGTQRALLERILIGAGYRVVAAADGAGALAAAEAIRPDLVILDLVMPHLNGFQTCRALRRQPATAQVPVLILSSKREPTDLAWAAEVGATEFLSKPVEPAALLRSVADLLHLE